MGLTDAATEDDMVVDCANCGGTGTVDIPVGMAGSFESYDCLRCEGTGVIELDRKPGELAACPICHTFNTHDDPSGWCDDCSASWEDYCADQYAAHLAAGAPGEPGA
jgi:hypothetical protein